MQKQQIAFLLLFFLPLTCFSTIKLEGINVGAGTLSPPTNYYQTNSSGDTNTIQFNFVLKSDFYFSFYQPFKFSCGIGSRLPKSDEVGNKRFEFYLDTKLHYKIKQHTLFVGPMLYFQDRFGTAESVTLDNGTGQSEFYLPDEHHFSRNLVIEIGGDITLSENIILQPTLLLIDINSRRKRNTAYLITINYYITPDMWEFE